MPKKSLIGIGLILLVSNGSLQAETLAISDPNLLSGLGAVAGDISVSTNLGLPRTSTGLAGDSLASITNGTNQGGFNFDQSATGFDQLLAITGFSSQVSTIRIWSYQDIPPSEVTIYASTSSTTSLDPSSYFTLYGQTALSSTPSYVNVPANNPNAPDYDFGYYQFNITSTADIKSLLFDFGSGNGTGAGGNTYDFARVGEVQAFGTVPEPSTYALMGCGLIGLFAMLRLRKLS